MSAIMWYFTTTQTTMNWSSALACFCCCAIVSSGQSSQSIPVGRTVRSHSGPVDRPFAFPGDSTRAVLIEVFGFAFDDLRQPSQDVRRKAQKRTMNDTSTFARARFHHHTGAGRSSWTPCAVGFDRDRCERSCRSTSLLTTEGRSLSDEFVQGIVE